MLSLVILAVSVVLVILILYLLDRVHSLEELAGRLRGEVTDGGKAAGDKNLDTSFLGFNGKALWDLLSGKQSTPPVPGGDVEMLRTKFRPLLEKHIKFLFNKGLRDARSGKPKALPKNDQPYNTLRGAVNLWLPSRNFSMLYNAGFEFASANEDTALRIEATLTENIHELFSKLELELPEALMDELLSDKPAASAATAGTELDADTH